MKRFVTLVGFFIGALLLIGVYEELEHPESRKVAVVTSAPVIDIHANAVAKSLNAAPGAIVCHDFDTTSMLFHLYSAHWEDTMEDQVSHGNSRLLNGKPTPAPDPSLYDCHLLTPGTAIHAELAPLGIWVVTAQLPDGTVIRGVTLQDMLSVPQVAPYKR